MGVPINNKPTAQIQRLRTDSSLSHRAGEGGGGLNAFYWYQIFVLDSTVVEVKEMFISHESLLTIAMYHHGKNTLIKLTHYDETKKRAHDSQIVRAKENLKLSHGGFSYR